MAKLFDASDIKNVRYGCTEYAVKRLTGWDLYEETGRGPGEIGFENVERLTGGKCTIHPGTVKGLRAGNLDGTMLRIRPTGQVELHTVIVIDGRSPRPIIEDQSSSRNVPAGQLLAEWKSAGMNYVRCSV